MKRKKTHNRIKWCWNAFDNMQTILLWLKKKLRQLGIERNFLSIIKGLFWKIHSYHHTHDEKLNSFPLRSGKRLRCLFLPPQRNIVLEVLTRTVRQENKKSKAPNWKGRSKTLSSQMKWSYIQQSQRIHKKATRANKLSQQSYRNKINTQKSTVFLCTCNEQPKKEIKKVFHL